MWLPEQLIQIARKRMNKKENWPVEDNSLYAQLRLVITAECALAGNKDLTVEQKIVQAKGFRDRAWEIRQELIARNKQRRGEYVSPLAQLLSDRPKEEHLVAEDILNNDNDYKYKSDKIKALLKGGINSMVVANILNMRSDMTVTVSYVEQIKKTL